MVAVNKSARACLSSYDTGRGRRARLGEQTDKFALTRLTKERTPSLPFLRMKDRILGKKYCLSLVIAGDTYARKLNRTYRKKDYVPNILSFSLEKELGEIVLDPRQARRECDSRGESFRFFVALLFIHALLHLKGWRHGSTMEKQEQKLLSAFHITACADDTGRKNSS